MQTDEKHCKTFEEITDEIPIEKCSSEKLEEMTAYWIKTKGELLGMKYAGNAQCINMEGIYLAGEPHTNS